MSRRNFPVRETGGLADAAGSLAARSPTTATRFRFYPGLSGGLRSSRCAGAAHKLRLKIEMGDGFYSARANVFTAQNLTVYLICREESFDRRGSMATASATTRTTTMFIFFSKAVVETLRLLELQRTSFTATTGRRGCYRCSCAMRSAVRHHPDNETVFTIHNIAFQGIFPMSAFHRTNLPDELLGIDGLEYYGQVSMLKGAILFSDRVTTVSPRYAKEFRRGIRVRAGRSDRDARGCLIGLINASTRRFGIRPPTRCFRRNTASRTWPENHVSPRVVETAGPRPEI